MSSTHVSQQMDITGFEETSTAQRRAISVEANVFTVPLTAYAFQPWSNRHPNLSQWFNYNLTPTTWNDYASSQLRMAMGSHHTGHPLSAGTSLGTAPSYPLHGPGTKNDQTRG